jgi:transcriptional regulator GlxA family with amidase domain
MIPAIHPIAFMAFPGFDLLDLGETIAVFKDASHLHGGGYSLHLISPSGGLVASSSGIEVVTERPGTDPLDTLIVLGGSPEAVCTPEPGLLASILRLASLARRVASTCTGAFLLAAAGLLQGRRATTHWRFAAELQARFPSTRIDADKIFVRDGNIWSSAGGTAGIDLALALVEDDRGREVSRQVARGLVVYHRRLGGQSQYSTLLDLDPPSDRIRRALAFAREHLHERLPVARLAEVASLSERQFTRAFLAETGMTPAKAVLRLRTEAARPHVEGGRQPLEVVARSVGFADSEQMRGAFVAAFGQAPRAIRRLSRADA